MENNKTIPTLGTNEIINFHLHSIEWIATTFNSKHPDFHINKIEDIKDKKNFNVKSHRKKLHDFFFLTKGKSIRTKGLNKYEIKGPAIFFLPSYQITEHEMISEDATGFYCYFSEELFDLFPKTILSDRYDFFQYQSIPTVSLDLNTNIVLEQICKRLHKLYYENEFRRSLCSIYLMAIFDEIKNISKGSDIKQKNSSAEITKRYKLALTKHIYDYHNVREFASFLNVSPNYLNKCVKNTLDKTAQDLLQEMLILEAKTLIKHSKLNISEIAVKLCDQTPSNFARFFKSQTGLSPKEYSNIK